MAAGRFIYVANKFSGDVSGYEIEENGALTPITGSPFPAGAGPDSVADK
jgi:6-phosphogluconolactonase (cycloisomerase 2 family)